MSEPKDIDRLYFPKEIAGNIGLPRNAICAMKAKGCKFFGKKTSIRWVRQYLEEAAKPICVAPPAAKQGLVASK
jgi:hypothetical protein